MTSVKAWFGVLVCLVLAPVVTANAAELSPADQKAAFEAAGFQRHGEQWRACEDPTPTYAPGAIETVRDLNGDGRPEAVVTEGGTFCYGNTGTGFVLVSKQADGTWKKIYSATGMAAFLDTKGVGGWPDIQVGGPGFCFPVVRWNGREYTLERHEYEGKPCRVDGAARVAPEDDDVRDDLRFARRPTSTSVAASPVARVPGSGASRTLTPLAELVERRRGRPFSGGWTNDSSATPFATWARAIGRTSPIFVTCSAMSVDVTGLVIYFSVANVVLRGTLI